MPGRPQSEIIRASAPGIAIPEANNILDKHTPIKRQPFQAAPSFLLKVGDQPGLIVDIDRAAGQREGHLDPDDPAAGRAGEDADCQQCRTQQGHPPAAEGL